METIILDTNRLIDGERGTVTMFSLIEYPPALPECEILFPVDDDFKLALHLSVKLRTRGTPIPAVDILIASMAINRNYPLKTTDKDFFAIQRVDQRLRLLI